MFSNSIVLVFIIKKSNKQKTKKIPTKVGIYKVIKLTVIKSKCSISTIGW